jgi:pimeloyl-ACP methyl ester carboxylesterase
MATLHSTRQGIGDPLVLIHGTGSELAIWKPILPELVSRFDVVAVDLPGFGASEPVTGTPTPLVLAAAVAEEIDRLGLDSPHVVGHSLGGIVGAELAAAGRARTFTGISPAGMATWPEMVYAKTVLRAARALGRATGSTTPRLLRSPAVRALTYGHSFARPRDIPYADALRMAERFVGCPGFRETVRATPMRMAQARLDQITCPSLIIWGDKDRLLFPAQARRWVQALPHARLRMIQGAGHTPMWDAPGATTRAILDFLARVVGGVGRMARGGR